MALFTISRDIFIGPDETIHAGSRLNGDDDYLQLKRALKIVFIVMQFQQVQTPALMDQKGML
ncbi:hypothetical protein [Undibacterium sp.]|uniref:hypothetical protein n=1 Tax=Undibacterium sp. TaxID=1914977 RepID=UPI0025D34505|nr:hypothetical protein [Undibacterium sp.]